MAAMSISSKLVHNFNYLMKYMFEPHYDSIKSFLELFYQNDKYGIILVKSNCSSLIKFTPQELGIISYFQLYGCQLYEPIIFVSPNNYKHKIIKTI